MKKYIKDEFITKLNGDNCDKYSQQENHNDCGLFMMVCADWIKTM